MLYNFSKMSKRKINYKPCATPWTRHITCGDTHELCVECLEAEHAKTALDGTAFEHCLWLPLRMLNSRAALFDESGKIVSLIVLDPLLSRRHASQIMELADGVSWRC